MHIQEPEKRRWIESYFEQPANKWTREEHLRILDKLNESEIFEDLPADEVRRAEQIFLEGAESTIVLLDEVCDVAANAGLSEVTIGMPHRGRGTYWPTSWGRATDRSSASSKAASTRTRTWAPAM